MVRILLLKQQQPAPYPNLCTFWVRTSRKTPFLFSPEPPHIVVLVRKKAVRVVATILDILEAAAIDRISLAVFPRTAEGAHQHFIGVHVAAAIGAHDALPARGWPSSSSFWLLSGTRNGWKRTQSQGSGEIASTPGALTALLSPPPATLPKRLLAAFRDAPPCGPGPRPSDSILRLLPIIYYKLKENRGDVQQRFFCFHCEKDAVANSCLGHRSNLTTYL